MTLWDRKESPPPPPDPDLSDWMGNLPEEARSLSLSHLCIPGSHDSFTYSLARSGTAGPDQPPCVRFLTRHFPCVSSRILYRWSRTQKADLARQLRGGIRYFDIRLDAVLEEKEEHYRVLHCLLGERIEKLLTQLKEFLDDHRGEVIILDFQHQYQFQDKDHIHLGNFILATFQGQIHPWMGEGVIASLQSLQDTNQRVVIIYPALAGSTPMMWPRKLCPNPWPDTTNTNRLRSSLVNGLQKRDATLLFVSQGILTPSATTVICHPFSGLRKCCGEAANKTVRSWLETGAKPNILIIDFVLGDSTSCLILTKLIENNKNFKFINELPPLSLLTS